MSAGATSQVPNDAPRHLVPVAGVEFDIAIAYTAPTKVSAQDEAALQQRIESASRAAETVLRTGLFVPLTTDMEAAIAEVLEARRRLRDLQPRGTREQAARLRAELTVAIDALGALFDEEEPHE